MSYSCVNLANKGSLGLFKSAAVPRSIQFFFGRFSYYFLLSLSLSLFSLFISSFPFHPHMSF